MKLLLILLTDLLIRIHNVGGDGCWAPMVCDGVPDWRKITPCNQELQTEAMKGLYKLELQKMTDQTAAMSNQLNDMRKIIKDKVETTTHNIGTTAVIPETTSVQETLEQAAQTTDRSVETAIYCDVVEAPQYGDLTASNRPPYPVGTTLTFNCDRGFKGKGKGIINCLKNGRWSDPVPYCQAYLCKKSQKKIEEGRKCRKACKSDADCKGTFKKCRCDDWCGKSCFNPDADCLELKSPENGYIVGSERSYGNTVTYGCNAGYILSGTATRRCRSDRYWSGYESTCVAFSTCGQPGDKDETLLSGKVIEGTDAKVGAWPWQALLLHSNGHASEQIYNREAGFGGGSIIDDKWILSAAHVLDIFAKASSADVWKERFLITVGLTVLPERGQALPTHVNLFEPMNVYTHPKFEINTYDYDVALIRIGKRLKHDGKKFVVDLSAEHNVFIFSRYIRPVCLPCIKGDPLGAVNIWKNFDSKSCNMEARGRSSGGIPGLLMAGIQAMVTGFGKKRNTGEDFTFRPKKLQEGLLKVFEDYKCVESVKIIQQDVIEARFTDRMLCAGSADPAKAVDSCQGDSGGPLVQQYNRTEGTKYWMQIGIVSWGWGCGNQHPGYYTSVTSIMSWVWTTIDDTRIGAWYNWSNWKPCSKTCGSGKQIKNRICSEKNCPGPAKEERHCNTKKCPTGEQCTLVLPPTDGSMVVTPIPNQFHIGTSIQFTCNEGKFMKQGPSSISCRENGVWSDTTAPVCENEWRNWSSWSPCTATCGGAKYKTRKCRRGSNIIVQALGCKGPTILYTKKTCNAEACPAENGCKGGDLCLQGDINVDSKSLIPHISSLLNIFGRRK